MENPTSLVAIQSAIYMKLVLENLLAGDHVNATRRMGEKDHNNMA
jgi:hypothetical protein